VTLVGGEGGLGGSLGALVPLLMRNLQDRPKADAPSHLQSAVATAPVPVQAVVTPPQPLAYKLDGQERPKN
jgi:hypothetical protein